MINLPLNRKTPTTHTLSQRCLPGGPASATYDISNYTYYSENGGGNTYPLQPSILAIDGDKQVGGYLYDSSSDDTNYNRGIYPSPHVVTEKAFYTELTPEYTQSFGPFGPIYTDFRGQTFLRVDLTEGGKVFRHNAVIVKGSIHCTTQRHIQPSDMQNEGSEPILYGLYDFEFYFVCQPLHSNYQPEGVSASELTELNKLKTLYSSYFYARNRSFGDDSLTASDGVTTLGFTQQNPMLGNASSLNPNHNWAEFALTSETNANHDEIYVVPSIQRPIPALDSNNSYVTPLEANLTTDPNDKWDLNHVNFRFALPIQQPFGVPNRFAVKGTYLLI